MEQPLCEYGKFLVINMSLGVQLSKDIGSFRGYLTFGVMCRAHSGLHRPPYPILCINSVYTSCGRCIVCAGLDEIHSIFIRERQHGHLLHRLQSCVPQHTDHPLVVLVKAGIIGCNDLEGAFEVRELILQRSGND